MADNLKKKRIDKKRVALTQDYEREYLVAKLEANQARLNDVMNHLEIVIDRLRAGFPKKSKRSRK